MSASGQPDSTMVTFSPEEQYAQVTMTLIIDNVCLHAAKVDGIRKTCSQMTKSMKDDKDLRALKE